MQSGISASTDLHTAFLTFLSTPNSRALFISISAAPESLVPGAVVPALNPQSADLAAELEAVAPLVPENKAAYIILRGAADGGGEGGGKTGQGAAASCVAVTYVPDAAPVRQKMLFASTRLTLVRELGIEHFASTLFATNKDELTPGGWRKHEAHGSLSAPLTEEERNLQGIREAEAKESTGTGARRGHVSSGVSLPVDANAMDALRRLKEGEEGLVQLQIDTAAEAVKLASVTPASSCPPSSVSTTISSSSPRYSFYHYTSPTSPEPSILFIYTCPSGASIKERMLYASSRASIVAHTSAETGLTVSKKIEAGSPDEVTEQVIQEEMEPKLGSGGTGGDGGTPAKAFSRPKRPGKR